MMKIKDKNFGITSNPWLRDIRSFLCALGLAYLSMCSFSLFLFSISFLFSIFYFSQFSIYFLFQL